MTLNKRIIEALESLGLPVLPWMDTQQYERCLIFNYSVLPTGHADDAPAFELYLVQVHYICPSGYNSLSERKAVKRALFRAGFSWPEETPANDSAQKNSGNKQHYVFECQWLEGTDDGTDEC